MFSRRRNYLHSQQQSLSNAITFSTFIDFTESFTGYLEVELPHGKGWKTL